MVYKGIFIRNDIEGTKRQIVFLLYHKNSSNISSDLEKLKEVYGLDRLYKFHYFEKVGIFSLVALDKRRVAKIYQNTHSINKSLYSKQEAKYRRTYIPIEIRSMADKIIDFPIVVPVPFKSEKKHIYSLPHFKLLNHISSCRPRIDNKQLIGNKENKQINTIKKGDW